MRETTTGLPPWFREQHQQDQGEVRLDLAGLPPATLEDLRFAQPAVRAMQSSIVILYGNTTIPRTATGAPSTCRRREAHHPEHLEKNAILCSVEAAAIFSLQYTSRKRMQKRLFATPCAVQKVGEKNYLRLRWNPWPID